MNSVASNAMNTGVADRYIPASARAALPVAVVCVLFDAVVEPSCKE